MLFAILLKPRAGTVQERMSRRAQWQCPAGMRALAEYWPQATDPRVISIVEAENAEPLMEAVVAWDDLFDITVVPALTAEQGLNFARRLMTAGAPIAQLSRRANRLLKKGSEKSACARHGKTIR